MNIKIPAQLPHTDKAKITLVGKVPSEQKTLAGELFVGPSGKLLNAGLRAAGIERTECLVTNVIDFELPKNNVKNVSVKKYAPAGPFAAWLNLPVASGAYLPQELGQLSLERLHAELVAAQPDIIVPLGGLALWAIMQVQGHGVIKKMRGAPGRAKLYDAPMLPTFHPAFILRSYHLNVMFISDLSKALRLANGDPGQHNYDIWEVRRPADFDEFIVKLSPPISVDIETVKRAAIDCIGFADAEHTFTVPFFDNKTFKPYWSLDDEIDIKRRICRFLSDASMRKLGQNFTYDLQVLWETWGMQVRGYEDDTRLCHHALFPELPKDLGSMAALHTWMPARKPVKGAKSKKDE